MTTPFAPLTDKEHQELDHFLMHETDAPDGMTFDILDGLGTVRSGYWAKTISVLSRTN